MIIDPLPPPRTTMIDRYGHVTLNVSDAVEIYTDHIMAVDEAIRRYPEYAESIRRNATVKQEKT